MGKKRKSGRSGATRPQSQPQAEEVTTAAKYDQNETFADSQDEFFTGKDEIMLEEGPSRKRRKQMDEDDRFLEPSDEEVLGYDSASDDDDPVESEPESPAYDRSDSEAENGVQDWGTSRADYYDADIIETEADALEEEAEARRLQQKQLQGMTEADFGFDESEWAQMEEERHAGHGTVVEKLPDMVVTEETPVAERLKILRSRYPELEPLSQDYTALQTTYEDLRIAANTASARNSQPSKKRKAGQGEPSPSIAVLKWRALSTYLGSIAMYFAILTAPASGNPEANAPTSPAELRQHPVMQSLLRSRQSWDAVKDVQLPEAQEMEEDSDAPPEEMPIKAHSVKVTSAIPVPALSVIKAPKKSKKPAESKAATSSSTKTKSLTSKDPAASKKLTSLDLLIASVKAPPTLTTNHPSSPSSSQSSDFGDEAPLTLSETASKAQRKRNLRFYTSQLAQKSNKRASASQNAGGDADLPYKERLKDRQVRLLREAEVRGKEKGNGKEGGREMDFRDDDSGEEDDRVIGQRDAAGDQAGGEDEEDYYQTLHTTSNARKALKASRAASLAQAATSRQGPAFPDDNDLTTSSKRAITYEISANKGLMPRRKKEVRNPRVKKRMKYDQKMKKLGSVRQVYKGGEGRGGYAGELTGIKTNVVRGVKL